MAKQTRQSNLPRVTARINAKLEKRLAAYVASAAAAGVSVLAAPQPAQAKVVYTPANTVVTGGTTIDLNHDGIADFTFFMGDGYEGGHFILLDVLPAVTGNGIRDNGSGAAVGFLGVPVGGGEKFATNTSYWGKGVFMASFFQYSFSNFTGPWAGVTNRYLGFKFLIDGQVHYGWARMSVSNIHNAVLTGYAYETIPNKTILEGHTSGPEAADNFAPSDLLAPSSQPAGLGMLARGADGLAIWRRENEEIAAL
jgi:hypothetical protein